jgi:hypothetical protein
MIHQSSADSSVFHGPLVTILNPDDMFGLRRITSRIETCKQKSFYLAGLPRTGSTVLG